MTALHSGGAAGDGAGTIEIVTAPTTGVRLAAKLDTREWLGGGVTGPIVAYFGANGLRLVLTDPVPFIEWSDAGATYHSASALGPLPFTAGVHWIAAELIFDDGGGDHTVEFLWSDDATDDPDTVVWTSLGVDTIAGTTDLFAAAGPTSIGGTSGGTTIDAYYLAAQIQVDGVTVAEPIFSAELAGTPSFDDSEGVTWVIVGAGAEIVEYPPPVGDVQLAGAVRSAVANAPQVSLPIDVEHPLRARILRLPDLSLVAPVFSARGDTAREQRNAPGSGSLTLMLDDPIAPLVRKYDLIQQIIEGQVAYTTLAEDLTTVAISTEEEAGEVLTIAGRGHLALLEMGTVYPSRGVGAMPIERDRVFKWTSASYDDSFWPDSVDAGSAEGNPREPGPQLGPPLNAPSVAGNSWRAGVGDTDTMAPVGTLYLRGQANIPVTREYMLIWSADNSGDLYADGQLIDSSPAGGSYQGFLDGRAVPITLTAGPITFAVRLVNDPLVVGGVVIPPGVGINPTGLFFVLATLNSDGTVDEVITTAADDPWKALRSATEPGMTPSAVARITLEEWQARATAAGHDIPIVSLTCTDAVDSAGQPWSETPNISTKVSNDLLTFYTEIAATYWEMRMRPASLDLDLFVKGTHVPSGVEYLAAPPGDPRAGNMRSLTRRVG